MLKDSRFLIVLMLILTSVSCSLPVSLRNDVNSNPPTPSSTQGMATAVNETLPSPANIIPNEDSLLGNWTVFQVNHSYLSQISHDESQTWLGNIAFFNPNSIQFNQNRCLLTAFERIALPENYQETFPLNLSSFGIVEEGVSLIRTNCSESPFNHFLQLDAYTILLQWQGSYFWLQQQTINAPQRPLIYSYTQFLREDITRNVNVQIPQITQDNAAGQNFNEAAFNLFNSITENFISETEAWEKPADSVFNVSDLEVTYDIHWNDGQRLSILGNIYTYYSGAAHPNLFFLTLNYDLSTQQILSLEDLFVPESDYLTFLRDTSIAALSSREIGFFEDSLAADPIYFQNITFTPAGMMIHFSPYDVASYAAGPQTVLIPYGDLEGYLQPAFIPPLGP